MLGGIMVGLGCVLCQKRLKLSSNVDKCKPLGGGQQVPEVGAGEEEERRRPGGRGLHSSTFQLNLRRFRLKIIRKHPQLHPDTP